MTNPDERQPPEEKPRPQRPPNCPITCPNCDEESLRKGQNNVWRCGGCGYEEQR